VTNWAYDFSECPRSVSQKKVDVFVNVGGFSTGARFGGRYAWEHESMFAGAVLFSPVSKSNSKY